MINIVGARLNWSMEQNSQSRPTYIRSIDLQQQCVGILIECSNQRELILLIQYIEGQD